MPGRLFVVHVSAEISPFASTGGLGEVAAAIPKYITRGAGMEACRFMPLHRQVGESKAKLVDPGIPLEITIGDRHVEGSVLYSDSHSPRTWFIRQDELFDRPELYGECGTDYPDNFDRFLFFQKAVVAAMDAIGIEADIVHCHDWQTGLVPLYLRHGVNGTERSGPERTVFTIHNLAYQGLFPGASWGLTGLPKSYYTSGYSEFYDQVSFLKTGLTTASRITTVSKTYAREILTPEFGCGLDGALRYRKEDLSGILNGVDYDLWNPETDPHLVANYSVADLAVKQMNKVGVIGEMGLRIGPEKPLLGTVARLAEQKGLDILAEAMPAIMKHDLGFALLGSGEPKYHAACKEWMARWPGRFSAVFGYHIGLSRRIEAGADIFLMPSRFEPCGLNQLYSLRYGTVPVVHATGGLEDTIDEVADGRGGTGFKFSGYTAEAFLKCIERALELYARPVDWLEVVARGMRKDFSWNRAAAQYLQLYESLAGPMGADSGHTGPRGA